MYLETDLRHPKFDTFRMPAAQQEWMLENADPRSGPDGINDKSIFYRRFLWFWAAGVFFFFGIWNELQKVDFLHSEGRRGRTISKCTNFHTDIYVLLAWYFQRIVDDISYVINVTILGRPREDYLTEMMKMQTPGTWFGTGADVSCGSALMDYQNRQRQSGPTAYASKLQAHEDRLQRQKEKEDERKARAAEAARKAQEAREAKAQEAESDNSDD